MTMTNDEEEALIKSEVDWTKKIAYEKKGELELATKRWQQAEFRANITQQALEDFYKAHPERMTVV